MTTTVSSVALRVRQTQGSPVLRVLLRVQMRVVSVLMPDSENITLLLRYKSAPA